MAEPFSEKDIILIESNTFQHTGGYASGHDPPNCDYCRFLATITADRKRFEETIDGYTKDWAKQKCKFQAEIERLRNVLEPFALFTMSVTFKESKNRFVKAVFEREDFRKARKALDAGKE